MEVKFHLAVNHAAQPLDENGRLVLRLSHALNLRQRGSRQDGERRLMDDLVARIELRNNEVHGGAVGQHAMFVRVFVRRRAGK